MIRRLVAAGVLASGLLAGAVAGFTSPALADNSTPPPGVCDNMSTGDACLQDPDGTWSVQHGVSFHPSYPGDPSDPGIPGAFIGWGIFVIAVGIGTTVWRVSTARRLARNAGLDEGDATAITLLGNDGLDAAYIASAMQSGRQRPLDPRQRPDLPLPRKTSVEDRLRELQRLHDEGLVTDDEYTQRRSAIVNSL